MKRLGLLLIPLLGLFACNADPEAAIGKQQKQAIIRNLPTQDRAYLLEPLEAALDDIRDIVDNDPGLFESNRAIDTLGWKGELNFRLNGADTVKVDLKIESDTKRERHWRYWDENGELFFMESTIKYLDDEGNPTDQRAYRLYFEENQAMISAYGRNSFLGKPLPNEWRTITPSPEELNYLMHIRRLR